MLRVLFLIFLTAFAAHAQERTTEQLKEQAKHFKNSKRFVISYDKFKDHTLVKAGPFGISGTSRYMVGGGFIFLSAGFLFDGQVLKQPVDEFNLMLEHDGNEWQFLDTAEMYLLIDGRREVLKTERDAATPTVMLLTALQNLERDPLRDVIESRVFVGGLLCHK